MKRMKLLVTGGAGYIGSITVEQLVRRGHEVIVFDNLYQGHRAAVHPDAVFIKGDLANRTKIAATLLEHRPDAVMHFVAYSLVGESMQRPFKYLHENVSNGLNLLEAMTEAGVRKFILSSTANLFDEPETLPIAEPSLFRPASKPGVPVIPRPWWLRAARSKPTSAGNRSIRACTTSLPPHGGGTGSTLTVTASDNETSMVYPPEKDDESTFTLVIFLHGAGGGGDDVMQPRAKGYPTAIWVGIHQFHRNVRSA